jgi:deoxyribose-phosphate aldolase
MTDQPLSSSALAQRIDHTLLKPTLTCSELETLCREAIQYQFKTVCIPPSWVPEAVHLLSNSPIGTITVVGFPLGYSTGASKAAEAREAVSRGAREIDMVLNVSYLKSARWTDAEADVAEVVNACGAVPVKAIIETAYLTEDEKRKAALLSERAGAAFVKTSTGFATGVPVTGATLEDIRLLRSVLKPTTRIKASGGIRDLEGAKALIAAGADRLGTSSGVALVLGMKTGGGY